MTLSFSNQASDIASRAGLTQTAVQSNVPKATKVRDSDTSVLSHVAEDHEGLAAAIQDFVPPSDKKVSRKETRETRRRRKSEVQGGEVEAQKLEGKSKSQSSSKAEKKTSPYLRRDADWTPAKGLKTAENLLNQQALLAQASIRFEQSWGERRASLSPFGQQQAMLDNLIGMTELLYSQHNGCDSFPYNRPAVRQIMTALRGLKDGALGVEEPTPPTSGRPMKKREFQFHMTRIERVQQALEPILLPVDYEELDLVA